MISDTLFDADAEIRAYLAAGANYGAEINKQIEEVLASMDALRHTLDALQTEVSAHAKELTEKAKRAAREKRIEADRQKALQKMMTPIKSPLENLKPLKSQLPALLARKPIVVPCVVEQSKPKPIVVAVKSTPFCVVCNSAHEPACKLVVPVVVAPFCVFCNASHEEPICPRCGGKRVVSVMRVEPAKKVANPRAARR